MQEKVTPAQMQEKLSQKGFKVIYHSEHFDEKMRDIYKVIDPSCPLVEQEINVLFNNLIKIDSIKGVQVMESILSGDAVVIYPKEFGIKGKWETMGFYTKMIEQDEFQF
jgi:hypothetical protein